MGHLGNVRNGLNMRISFLGEGEAKDNDIINVRDRDNPHDGITENGTDIQVDCSIFVPRSHVSYRRSV